MSSVSRASSSAGIAEAATRPTMRFVELKSQDRLDLQTLHRARSRLVAARKSLVNQLRAILLERGYTFRQGRKVLERELDPFLAEPPSELSTRIVTLIADMRAEWRSLDERIDALNDDLTEHARVDEAANRLTSIPGIGILGATALVAAVGDGEAFRRARDVPAWLGLVPKQMTTGGKPRLLSITKRGNTYLRMLLIHGARAPLPSLSRQATPLGDWLRGLLSRAHRNVVIVALAGKRARGALSPSPSGRLPRRHLEREEIKGAASCFFSSLILPRGAPRAAGAFPPRRRDAGVRGRAGLALAARRSPQAIGSRRAKGSSAKTLGSSSGSSKSGR